jgi:hypothetical protein
MKLTIIPAFPLVVAAALSGCQGNSGPGGSAATRYNPPNTEFAAQLGIAPPPPVTAEQAKAIAAESDWRDSCQCGAGDRERRAPV